MRSLLACLVLIAACSRPTAVLERRPGDAAGGSGAAGSGGTPGAGSGGEGGSGPWSAEHEGQVDPFMLAPDESHVIYGVRQEGSAVGSLRVLAAGRSEPIEVDPAALLVFPEPRFLMPPPGILPAPAGALLAYPLLLDGEFGPPYPVRLMRYGVDGGARVEVGRDAIHGIWSFVPGTGDLLYVDTALVLRRVPAGGGPARELVRNVAVRSSLVFADTAALAPGGAHVAVVANRGLALVDLRTNTSSRIETPVLELPSFSRDGSRLGYATGDGPAILDLATGATMLPPRAAYVALSPDLTHALALNGRPFSPAPATLADLAARTEIPLGERVVRGGFTGGGRWVWVGEDLEGARRLRVRSVDGAHEHVLDLPACRHAQELWMDDAGQLVAFTRCEGDELELVARRLSDAAEFPLGRRTVLSVDPAGRGLLLTEPVPGWSLRLSTWDAATGALHDRGTVDPQVLVGENRVLVVRPDPPEIRVLDPLDPAGEWVLGAGRPSAWAIGRRRAAFSDGQRVVLADLP